LTKIKNLSIMLKKFKNQQFLEEKIIR